MDKTPATRLWEQFRGDGDPAVFERLYRAFRIPVMRYCRARIHDEEAAEDVCARVFTYLATGLHREFRIASDLLRSPALHQLPAAASDGDTLRSTRPWRFRADISGEE